MEQIVSGFADSSCSDDLKHSMRKDCERCEPQEYQDLDFLYATKLVFLKIFLDDFFLFPIFQMVGFHRSLTLASHKVVPVPGLGRHLSFRQREQSVRLLVLYILFVFKNVGSHQNRSGSSQALLCQVSYSSHLFLFFFLVILYYFN